MARVGKGEEEGKVSTVDVCEIGGTTTERTCGNERK